MPAAVELGMGITPWSPLRGGVLSGKFTRSNPPKDDGSTRVRSDSAHLNERTYTLLDALHAMAARKHCTVAQLALRWVMDRQGVASTIIGARTVQQLDDNMGAMAVTLTAAETADLDALTTPNLPFPAEFLTFIRDGLQNGTTINGVPSRPWPMSPAPGEKRW